MVLSRAKPPSSDRVTSIHWFLGALIAVVLVAALTAAAIDIFDLGAEPRSGGGAGGGDGASTTVPSGTVLADGQTLLSGTISRFAGEGMVLPPVPLPLTITTPERGAGAGGRIEGAVVDGTTSSVLWDAGRPLSLSGTAGGEALQLAPIRVDITAGSQDIRLALDGPVHGFTPGGYRIDTPVAVGSSGLARPLDRVAFEATDQTTATFQGGAVAMLTAQPLQAKGPGLLLFEGDLEITTRKGKQAAHKLEFGKGAFELSLTPTDGGYAVTATLQGPIRVDG